MQEMRRNSWLKVIWLAAISLLCVGLDQLSKYLCVNNIALGESVTVIPGVLDFTYIRNDGAAFGSFSNARWIFMIASVVMILLILWYVVSKREEISIPAVITFSLIVGGGIGNMIDRIAYGYVIDFIDVKFLPFWKWIFNVADSFVCVGAVLLALMFIIGEYKTKKAAAKPEAVIEKEDDDVTTDL